MSKDWKELRADLQMQTVEPPPSDRRFVLMLISVLVVGGAGGLMMFPRSEAAVVDAAQQSSAIQTVSEKPGLDIEDLRREQLTLFRETQIQLLTCARTQASMADVYTDYSERNLDAYEAWFQVLNPTDQLSDMADMTPLEATAHTLAIRNAAIARSIEDIEREVAAVQVEINPVLCGALNAKVQKREMDLAPLPRS